MDVALSYEALKYEAQIGPGCCGTKPFGKCGIYR